MITAHLKWVSGITERFKIPVKYQWKITESFNESGTSEKITDQLDDFIEEKPGNLLVHFETSDFTNNVNLLNNVKKIFRKVSKDSPPVDLTFFPIIVGKDKKKLWENYTRLRKVGSFRNFCS